MMAWIDNTAYRTTIGLFAGYGATFIRDAPFAGIYLFFYEGCKTWANGMV